MTQPTLLIPTSVSLNLRNSATASQINLGVGGTEYAKLLLYQQLRDSLNVHLISDDQYYENIDHILLYPDTTFLLLTTQYINTKAKQQYLDNLGIRSIYWSQHPSDFRRFYYINNRFECVVSGGLKQYALNDLLFKNHIWINNLFPAQLISRYVDGLQARNTSNISILNKNYVVYCGSFLRCKGLIDTIEGWLSARASGCNLDLYIIGSSSFYQESLQTASSSIPAEPSLVRQLNSLIPKQLLDNNSIRFFGSMGLERFEIFKHALAGITNPIGVSESYNYTMLEMMSSGLPIITSSRFGNMDRSFFLPWGQCQGPDELAARLLELEKIEPTRLSLIRETSRQVSLDLESLNIASCDRWQSLVNTLLSDSYRHKLYKPLSSLSLQLISLILYCRDLLISTLYNLYKHVASRVKLVLAK